MLTSDRGGHLIAGDQLESPADTVLNTAWLQTGSYAPCAQVAVTSAACDFVEKHEPVRASVNTKPATRAASLIDSDRAILSLGDSAGRADRDTYRLLAMKAGHGHEIHVKLTGELPRLDSHHPAPAGCCLNSEAVLLATGNFAGVAAHAPVEIDQHYRI